MTARSRHTVRVFARGESDLSPVTLAADDATPLIDLLRDNRFNLVLPCGGRGTCGKCQIRIVAGRDFTGRDIAGRDDSSERRKWDRAATVSLCQTRVDSDLLVELDAGMFPLPNEHPARSESTGRQTPVVGPLAVAVDLGTTTLVAALVDLPSGKIVATRTERNPQREAGADVISRIQYALSSPGAAERLQTLVTTRIDGMIGNMIDDLTDDLNNDLNNDLTGKSSGDSVGDSSAVRNSVASKIVRVVVAGNTAMSYLLTGTSVEPLAAYPFEPPRKSFEPGTGLPAIRFDSCPDAPVEIMPVFAGFVGGDIVAGVLAIAARREIEKRSGPYLLIDLGTNGELALVSDTKIYVAATAAGPAFEGANIEFGMTAESGAIRAVAPAAGTQVGMTVKTCDDTPPRGICGSGLIDAVAALLDTGLLASGGRFAHDNALGAWRGARAFQLTPEPHAVWLTQKDIRAVQLATGAVRAGVRMILEASGVAFDELDRVYLAGLFGNHINLDHAGRIGLIPPEVATSRIVYAGNSALDGAIRFALDPSVREKIERLTARAVHLDLARSGKFEEEFMRALIFPTR